MSEENAERSRVPLTSRERRVIGVLVEKAKTTPEYYPLSVAAIVTGCNQKSNRDPVTDYDVDDAEDILQSLRKKGATIQVEGSGRVVRWKHTLYDWLQVSKVELAVLAELLLRGPQTLGDLRARASRMEPLADQAALQAELDRLEPRGLVVYLSPPGRTRGVVVTHGLYPPEELAKVRAAFQDAPAPIDDERPPARLARAEAGTAAMQAGPGWSAEAEAIRAELRTLRETMDALTAQVEALKSALGD